jgi:hypothetical protein
MSVSTPSTAPIASPPRQRRWVPLSLRIFVGIQVLLFFGGLLWFGIPALRQDMALREIERCGGHAKTRPGNLRALGGWLSDRVIRCFDEVYWVNLSGMPIDDAGLSRVAMLNDLEALNLNETNVTDNGLRHLRGLSRLDNLSLNDTAVTSRGLEQLAGLGRLKFLSLIGTATTDAGLACLARMPELWMVWLDDTQVTDAGISKFKKTAPGVHAYHHSPPRVSPALSDAISKRETANKRIPGRRAP